MTAPTPGSDTLSSASASGSALSQRQTKGRRKGKAGKTKAGKTKAGKTKNKLNDSSAKAGGRPSSAKRASPDDWENWCDYLQARRDPRPLAKLLESKKSQSPLVWNAPLSADSPRDSATLDLLRVLAKLPGTKPSNDSAVRLLEAWLSSDPLMDPPPQSSLANVRLALECLGWAHALPLLAPRLPAAPWTQLLERLLSVARQAAHGRSGLGLEDQLLAGELPLTLACVLPELDECRQLRDAARQVINSGIDQRLDGEGLPHARHWPIARPLAASWLRCVQLDERVLRSDGRTQMEWMVRRLMELSRGDGSQVLATPGCEQGAWCEPLFRAMLRQWANDDDRAVAACALPGKQPSAKHLKRAGKVETSVYSEWAEAAVMRSDWSPGAYQFALTFHDRQVHSELSSGRHQLWSGPWETHVQYDGNSLTCGEWSELCWYSDHDVHYLELESALGDGIKCQRQVILARRDGFLFLSDALLAPQRGRWEYESRLPLTSAAALEPAEETREAMIATKKRKLARVFPVASPEWRVEPSAARLSADASAVVHQFAGEGTRIYLPLFVDLQKRRWDKPFTWRRLTVAERMEIQSPDVAVGYRVRAGKSQWLIYRSLAASSNRSLLGQNLASEFYLGRFRRDGEVEDMVEIETE